MATSPLSPPTDTEQTAITATLATIFGAVVTKFFDFMARRNDSANAKESAETAAEVALESKRLDLQNAEDARELELYRINFDQLNKFWEQSRKEAAEAREEIKSSREEIRSLTEKVSAISIENIGQKAMIAELTGTVNSLKLELEKVNTELEKSTAEVHSMRVMVEAKNKLRLENDRLRTENEALRNLTKTLDSRIKSLEKDT